MSARFTHPRSASIRSARMASTRRSRRAVGASRERQQRAAPRVQLVGVLGIADAPRARGEVDDDVEGGARLLVAARRSPPAASHGSSEKSRQYCIACERRRAQLGLSSARSSQPLAADEVRQAHQLLRARPSFAAAHCAASRASIGAAAVVAAVGPPRPDRARRARASWPDGAAALGDLPLPQPTTRRTSAGKRRGSDAHQPTSRREEVERPLARLAVLLDLLVELLARRG